MKKYKGVFLKAGVLNHNGRIYTEEALANAVKQFNELENPMYGQLDYPDSPVIGLSNVSHKVNDIFVRSSKIPRKKKKALKKKGQFEAWKQKNSVLVGEIEFVDTPQGQKAQKIMKDCVVRPMGTGTINEDGIVENFNLISFSIVPKETDSFKGL